MRRLLPIIALAASFAAAAPASATLVFERGFTRSNVWIANDDGTNAKRLAPGRNPHISPDGSTVLLGNRFDSRTPLLQKVPATGGTPQTILRRWQSYLFAWSPDGSTVATIGSRARGPQRLVTVDVASGTVKTVARGYFTNASFSPDSTQLVYGRGPRDDQAFNETDLYVAPVAGGKPTKITTDGRSEYPVWGPTQIAYVRWERTPAARKQGGPQFNLWMVNPDGTGARQLTDDRVPYLLAGLTPTAFSEDGTKLLAQFGGQDTSYAVGVDPASGEQRPLGPQGEIGIQATAISRDGTTVLGNTQTLSPRPRPAVVTIPWTTGKPTQIVKNGMNPDWNR